MSPRSSAVIRGLVLATGLVGCGSGASHSGTSLDPLPAGPLAFPGAAKPVTLTVPFVDSNSVGTFDAKTGDKITLLRGSATMLSDPYAATTDSAGNLYVVSSGQPASVLEFAKGSTGGIAPLVTDVQSAYGIASDGTNIYIGDPDKSQILEYAANPLQLTPWATLGGYLTMLCAVRGIALDSLGDIYVAQESTRNCPLTGVLVFSSLDQGIQDFSPSRTVSGRLTNFRSPQGIAVDAMSNVYIADSSTSLVLKFTAHQSGNVRPAGTFGSGATAYYGVAVDAENNLYASALTAPGDQYGEIDVFDATKPSTLPKRILKIGRKTVRTSPYLLSL